MSDTTDNTPMPNRKKRAFVPTLSSIDTDVAEYLSRTGLVLARWENAHGTCMVQTFISGLCVLPRLILDLMEDSDDPKKPLIRPSLIHYRHDADALGADQTTLPDNNTYWWLLMKGIYTGVQELDHRRIIKPKTWLNTIDPIFANLKTSLWDHLLFHDLEPKGVTVAKDQLATNMCTFTHVNTDVKYAKSFTKGFVGRLCFLVSLKFRRADNTCYGHAISLFWDSKREREFLRLCNGNLRLLESVGGNSQIYSEALIEPDSTLESEQIFYVIGVRAETGAVKGALQRPQVKLGYWAHIKKELAKRRERDEEKKKRKEKEEKKKEDGKDGKKKEEKKKEYKTKKTNLHDIPDLAPPKTSAAPSPNITFCKEPVVEGKDTTFFFEDDTGNDVLRWTGTETDGGLQCLKGPKTFNCRQKHTRLALDADIDKVKRHIVDHRGCHKGCRTGNKAPFPEQSDLSA